MTPFYYLESEKKIECLFRLTDQREVNLKGYIDRIDDVNGRVRIVDYKSGSGTTQFTTIDNLFDREEKVRSKAVMQVFMYAWMYLQKKKEKTVQPVIYYMRDLFKLSFDPSIYRKIDRTKSEEVMDFEGYRLDFEQGLRSCLDEIFDKETPFVQTNNPKVCSYCPFKDICGK